MSNEQISHLIQNDRDLVKKVAGKFFRFNSAVPWVDVYRTAQRAFYRAILTYDPHKGPLTSYAFHYCWGYIRWKFGPKKKEVAQEFYPIGIEQFPCTQTSFEDSMLLKELMAVLDDDEKGVVEAYAYGMKTSEAAEDLKMTRFHYEKKFNTAMLKMRRLV